jgi:hypothetical protein
MLVEPQRMNPPGPMGSAHTAVPPFMTDLGTKLGDEDAADDYHVDVGSGFGSDSDALILSREEIHMIAELDRSGLPFESNGHEDGRFLLLVCSSL